MSALLFATLLLAAPPALRAPVVAVGDEIVYAGDIVEQSRRFDQPYTRTSTMEIRVFALAVRPESTDFAILSLLRSQDDAAIAKVAADVTGAVRTSAKPPGVRLELIRLDSAGRVVRLMPEAGSFLRLTARTPTVPATLAPLDGPWALDVGMFPPRSAEATWTCEEPDRPTMHWTAKETGVLNGAEVVELAGEQQTPAWANPTGLDRPWRRIDRVWVSPADGLARVVGRTIEQKDGIHPALNITTRLDMRTPVPHRGDSFTRTRREIEFAYTAAAGVDPLIADAKRHGPRKFEATLAMIAIFKQDHPATPYRDAIDAVARRCEAALKAAK